MLANLLIDQLALVGLEVHEGKTKILTSDARNSIDFIEIGGGIIEILLLDKHHKYLGKHLIASPKRASVELHHRIQIAWHSFHKHRKWLTNKAVPVQLRLRLFASVVTPCIMFASAVLPLTQSQIQHISCAQRNAQEYY